MKKTILLAMTVIGLTTVACRKERTCECKTTNTEVTNVATGTHTNVTTSSTKVTEEKQTKKAFKYEQHCFSEQYTTLSDNGNTQTTTVTECDLK